ncbi:MAG: hypothetical protein ACRELD_15580, partial [Longimicrobiales bacterium]
MTRQRATADDRLARILYLLAAAAGEQGAALRELAEALDITPTELLDDLREVSERAYYRSAGDADDLQITVERDRVRIWTGGELRRPPRLSAREALALGLG